MFNCLGDDPRICFGEELGLPWMLVYGMAVNVVCDLSDSILNLWISGRQSTQGYSPRIRIMAFTGLLALS